MFHIRSKRVAVDLGDDHVCGTRSSDTILQNHIGEAVDDVGVVAISSDEGIDAAVSVEGVVTRVAGDEVITSRSLCVDVSSSCEEDVLDAREAGLGQVNRGIGFDQISA